MERARQIDGGRRAAVDMGLEPGLADLVRPESNRVRLQDRVDAERCVVIGGYPGERPGRQAFCPQIDLQAALRFRRERSAAEEARVAIGEIDLVELHGLVRSTLEPARSRKRRGYRRRQVDQPEQPASIVGMQVDQQVGHGLARHGS